MLISEILRLAPEILKYSIPSDCSFSGAYLDSRLVKSGSLFFGVKGENADGNTFADVAAQRGAAAVILDNHDEYLKANGNKFLVKDTLSFMKEFGRIRFENCKGYKIAVTGSFGKTGTKEMLRLVFGRAVGVYATEGNKNNHMGTALTACGTDESPVIVAEIGSNAHGEIAELSNFVKPDTAIITSVGHAHVGRFGGIEGVIKEKLSILSGLKDNGVLIAPYGLKDYIPNSCHNIILFGTDDKAHISIDHITHKGTHTLFKVRGSSQLFRINHPYIHLALGSLPVIAAARLYGIDDDVIAQALGDYFPLKGRGATEQVKDILLIDDTYNAGLESMVKAAESLNMMPVSPKYAVFGETGEIEGYEREIYEKITALSDKYPQITFYFVGSSYSGVSSKENCLVFTDRQQALNEVKKIKSGAVVIKASRSKKFEEFVQAVKTSAEGVNAL